MLTFSAAIDEVEEKEKNNPSKKSNVNKNKIIKAYIIGKKTLFFEKKIKKKIPYTISYNIKNALDHISNDLNLRSAFLYDPS